MELTNAELQAELQRVYTDMFATGLREEAAVITDGHLMPVEYWANRVVAGDFIDYDGHARWAMRRVDNIWLLSNLKINPSAITRFNIQPPEWATHVVWYNR